MLGNGRNLYNAAALSRGQPSTVTSTSSLVYYLMGGISYQTYRTTPMSAEHIVLLLYYGAETNNIDTC